MPLVALAGLSDEEASPAGERQLLLAVRLPEVGTVGPVTRLILINGAPGVGKSTLATALAQGWPLTLALDIDGIKHALGRWEEDPTASGLHARQLALALAHEQLRSGLDVVIGQYLARTRFIDDLEQLAERCGAQFVEFILDVDAAALGTRLAARASHPDRPEHEVNVRLVGPDDASSLVASITQLRKVRPRAIWVDATGSIPSTLAFLHDALPPRTP